MPGHDVARETSIDARRIAWTGIALLVLVVAVVALVFGWRAATDGRVTRPQPVVIDSAAPRLQTAPADDRADYERDQRRRLQGQGWVDRDAGIAQMPIEQAEKRLVERTTAAEPAQLWNRIGFDQHLDARLPLDATFSDDAGAPTTLGAALGGKPALLVLNYYDCPNLCHIVLQAVFDGMMGLGLAPGREFTLTAVSIDPRETPALAAAKKNEYLTRYKRTGEAAGVRFLTGDAGNIARLAQTAGFRYVYDAKLDQFAHAAGLMVVTPDGRIARYLFGAQFPMLSLRLALIEAAQDRIGTLADRIWLLCFHYDPAQGRYGLVISNVLRAGALLTAIVLAGSIGVVLARERRAQRQQRPPHR